MTIRSISRVVGARVVSSICIVSILNEVGFGKNIDRYLF